MLMLLLVTSCVIIKEPYTADAWVWLADDLHCSSDGYRLFQFPSNPVLFVVGVFDGPHSRSVLLLGFGQ
jgi:hypothetical protein